MDEAGIWIAFAIAIAVAIGIFDFPVKKPPADRPSDET